MTSFFLLQSSFFRTQLDHWQAPKQRPIIDRHRVEQIAYRRDIKDNGYKSVFTNSWLVRQRNRSWIKGLGKNPQTSELIHWRQCLLSEATKPCPLELRETLVCIHVHDGTEPKQHRCWPTEHIQLSITARQLTTRNVVLITRKMGQCWLAITETEKFCTKQS